MGQPYRTPAGLSPDFASSLFSLFSKEREGQASEES